VTAPIRREVILPATVANAQLKVLKKGHSIGHDSAAVTTYVSDSGIRALGTVKATDGSPVDLSTFDGFEQPGVRVPRMQDDQGFYLRQPVWRDVDAHYLPRIDWTTHEGAHYEGKTPEGWDKHVQVTAPAASLFDLGKKYGVAPYLKLNLGGEVVRAWLTPEGNVKDPQTFPAWW
jgi:hypothetical protein